MGTYLFNTIQAAEKMGVSEEFVRSLIKDGELKAIKIPGKGGGFRTRLRDIDDYFDRASGEIAE